MDTEQKRIGALVTIALWGRLQEASERLDLSLAQIVRRAVQEWLGRNAPAPEGEK